VIRFWEWLGQGCKFGFVHRLLREGDEGHQTFLAETNRAFRTWIGTILRMGRFTDPRNEAKALGEAADNKSGLDDYLPSLPIRSHCSG
jgi:hypothetical protein